MNRYQAIIIMKDGREYKVAKGEPITPQQATDAVREIRQFFFEKAENFQLETLTGFLIGKTSEIGHIELRKVR